MKTSHLRASDVEERWYLFDASKHVLGRMASDIAVRLMGKDRPTYTPSETGATHVVVVNAGKVRVTGKKNEDKRYRRYSGYAGGLKIRSLAEQRESKPCDVITLAVRRMLPKSNLGKKMLSHLKVYAGSDHPHAAQRPETVESLIR